VVEHVEAAPVRSSENAVSEETEKKEEDHTQKNFSSRLRSTMEEGRHTTQSSSVDR
jgi:hypothetical protein